MTDALSEYYADLLDGSYDCVDRIVLNAYHTLCYAPAGFRTWWRRLMDGAEEQLDNAHLMRMAGRFSRRLRAFAKAHDVPLVDCGRGERKHLLAEEYLATHPQAHGLFLILVSRAMAPVWEVERSSAGTIRNIAAKKAYVQHYSFHILDPEWGHLTIKMAGHPPFGAQIILNGHEYVACQARTAGITFTKEGNCFTDLSNATALATLADTLSQPETIGRLTQVAERWIYSACLCFGLTLDEQERSGFRYQYSVYQVEYSRNLLFQRGGQMEQVFQGLIDRTRAQVGVRQLRTIFGAKARPHRDRKSKAPHVAVVVETPVYDLTVFKLHFGKLTLKAYTKGERVLRFEAIVHNAKELRCGRVVERFPHIVARLQEMVEGFLTTLHGVDHACLAEDTLEQLSTPSQLGKTRIGGLDLTKPRLRTVLAAVLALAPTPRGFRVGDLAAAVQARMSPTERAYGTRQAAYDLKKLRAKQLISKVGDSRRYQVPLAGLRTIAALVILHEKVLKPLLAGTAKPRMGRKPKTWSAIDEHYETLHKDMHILFADLGIAAA
jgi:hypothetical protein